MKIPQIKDKIRKQYPHVKFKEVKEGDITFLFTNLEDEELHDADYNHLCNNLESRSDVPVSIEFNAQAR
jgi:hypothetical protein